MSGSDACVHAQLSGEVCILVRMTSVYVWVGRSMYIQVALCHVALHPRLLSFHLCV